MARRCCERRASAICPTAPSAFGVAPYDSFDAALYGGITAETWLQPGIKRGDVGNHQASFYKRRDPDGLVSLILGAGNVSSIPPMDILYKMFIDGSVVLLKMNPVNEYLGPLLERAFRALIDRGYLAIVYGGAEVGSYLCYHPSIGDVHITGSDKTHDLIVWGPPGPEREERKRRNDPLLKKPITSELGNVSPVLVVPGPYTDAELSSMAENTAGMITNNASFNCNAAKMLVLPKGWALRDSFIKKLTDVLATVPPAEERTTRARRSRFEGVDGRPSGRAKDRQRRRVCPAVDARPRSRRGERQRAELHHRAVLLHPQRGLHRERRRSRGVPADRHGLRERPHLGHLELHASSCTRRARRSPGVEGPPSTKRSAISGSGPSRSTSGRPSRTPSSRHPGVGIHGMTLANVQSGLGWVHNAVMLEDIEKTASFARR